MAASLEWVAWRIAIKRPSEPFPAVDQDFHGPLKLARMLASDLVNDIQNCEDEYAISG